jgi:hypothetical protein
MERLRGIGEEVLMAEPYVTEEQLSTLILNETPGVMMNSSKVLFKSTPACGK